MILFTTDGRKEQLLHLWDIVPVCRDEEKAESDVKSLIYHSIHVLTLIQWAMDVDPRPAGKTISLG